MIAKIVHVVFPHLVKVSFFLPQRIFFIVRVLRKLDIIISSLYAYRDVFAKVPQ